MSDWKMDGKPALLLLHMQNSIIQRHKELLIKTGVISNQQKLLKAFRSKNLPVIFVNVTLNPPIAGKIPAYGDIWKRVTGTTNDPESIKVIPELTPEPGEPILFNWPTGAFNNSGLDGALKMYGVQTVVLAGVSTNHVVTSAMQGAADRYYSVILPRDASSSVATPEAHEIFMDKIAPAVSLVTTTEDLIAHL